MIDDLPITENIDNTSVTDTNTDSYVESLIEFVTDLETDTIIKDAFRLACRYGHLEVAKWLFSVKSNIGDGELAFHFTCINGHLEVVKWLLSVKPYINISLYEMVRFMVLVEMVI